MSIHNLKTHKTIIQYGFVILCFLLLSLQAFSGDKHHTSDNSPTSHSLRLSANLLNTLPQSEATGPLQPLTLSTPATEATQAATANLTPSRMFDSGALSRF